MRTLVPIRRTIEHLKSQNWVAATVEFVVVVIGIFLAFQVDRWYESSQKLEDVRANLVALSNDFADSRKLLDESIARHERAAEAALRVTSIGVEEAGAISHRDFYSLLRAVYAPLGFSPVRRTYDAMISTGEIEVIPDAELKQELASFFALMDVITDMQENLNLLRTLVLDPYFAKNLDLSAILRLAHPEVIGITLSRDEDQFREIIGDEEFEGVVMAKWHMSYDLTRFYERAMERIDAIDRRIQVVTSENSSK